MQTSGVVPKQTKQMISQEASELKAFLERGCYEESRANETSVTVEHPSRCEL